MHKTISFLPMFKKTSTMSNRGTCMYLFSLWRTLFTYSLNLIDLFMSVHVQQFKTIKGGLKVDVPTPNALEALPTVLTDDAFSQSM